ncbi:MAG: glycosyltransferase family 39 protein [Planctomycetia bacterium]|nr:glycosyltransferase family 39 protein [Planctomycetia bacterium]
MRKEVAILVVILLVGLFFRLALLCCMEGEKLEIVDETHYNALALELHDSGCYASDARLVSLRPPLYPWAVSEIYRVFGAENFLAVRVFQIILSLLTTVGVYFLSREVYPDDKHGIALLAAALFCFYPSLIVDCFFLLTETVFTFFLVCVLLTAVRFFRTQSLYAIAFCGVFIGLGALTRSILWLSPAPFAIFVWLVSRGTPWWRRIAAVFLLLLFSSCTMAPWIIRNTRVQKTFTAIDCMSGRNLMMGNYEFTPMYRAWDAIVISAPNDWMSVLAKDYRNEVGESLYSKTQGEKDRAASRYALRYMAKNPVQTLERMGVKALCFWQLERSIPGGFARGWWGAPEGKTERTILLVFVFGLINFFYVAIFASALGGVFSSDFRGKEGVCLAFFLCVVVFFWGIHSLVFAHERYHLPLIPILALIASKFWCSFPQSWQYLKKHPAKLGVCGGMLLVYAVFWCCEIGIYNTSR